MFVVYSTYTATTVGTLSHDRVMGAPGNTLDRGKQGTFVLTITSITNHHLQTRLTAYGEVGLSNPAGGVECYWQYMQQGWRSAYT